MRVRYDEPRVMRELHEIREKHYEETKHLSREEYIRRINENAFRIMKEYNMNFKIVDRKKH